MKRDRGRADVAVTDDDAALRLRARGEAELREVGKRVSQKDEEDFLKQYYREMPRTMLRYAIERFNESKRKRYLAGLV